MLYFRTLASSIATSNKLTAVAVPSIYKKVSDKINDNINIEGKRIMENKATLNRVF